MKADDPAVLDIMRRSMVARIATLSRNGRPSINPLYFVYLNGHIWLGTASSLLVVATEVSKTHSSGSMPSGGWGSHTRITQTTRGRNELCS